jgi:hypothetical protein
MCIVCIMGMSQLIRRTDRLKGVPCSHWMNAIIGLPVQPACALLASMSAWLLYFTMPGALARVNTAAPLFATLHGTPGRHAGVPILKFAPFCGALVYETSESKH